MSVCGQLAYKLFLLHNCIHYPGVNNVLVFHGAEIGIAVKLVDCGTVGDVIFFIGGESKTPQKLLTGAAGLLLIR